MVLRILSIVSSFASIISLICVSQPVSGIQWIFIGVLIAGLIVTLVVDICDYYKTKPKTFKSGPKQKEEIAKYMFNWISHAGRTVIFSRDMSWVENYIEIEEMLVSKAKRDELCICLPKRTSLTDKLEQNGALICEYPQLDHTPKSRFTIINMGRDDARVAVGKGLNGNHVIEEIGNGEAPFFAVANDLVEIITKFSKIQREKNKDGEHKTNQE